MPPSMEAFVPLCRQVFIVSARRSKAKILNHADNCRRSRPSDLHKMYLLTIEGEQIKHLESEACLTCYPAQHGKVHSRAALSIEPAASPAGCAAGASCATAGPGDDDARSPGFRPPGIPTGMTRIKQVPRAHLVAAERYLALGATDLLPALFGHGARCSRSGAQTAGTL